MACNKAKESVRLRLEPLETREVLSAPGIAETFDTTAKGLLPAGWSQWSSHAGTPFMVASDRAVSGTNSLSMVSPAFSFYSGRTWNNEVQPADVEVSSSLFLNSLVPAQLFVRGSDLSSATPDYYAVSVSHGLKLSLVRVRDGVTAPLGQLQSAEWFSGKWVRVSMQAVGDSLRVRVLRLDQNLYLNKQGRWQSQETWALERRDSLIKGEGRVGIARPASYTGAVSLDDFEATPLQGSSPSGMEEKFDQTQPGSLPNGWSQWSSMGGNAFAVSANQSSSGPNGLASSSPSASKLEARAWHNSQQPANVSVSASIYVDSLIPAQVFARGTSVNSSTPSYYAVSVTHGLNLSLLRVENGNPTVLASLKSSDWVTGKWIRVTLYANGNNLRVQVSRLDQNTFLNEQGKWQSASTWAINTNDGNLTAAGLAGVARPSSYTGTIYFDDFLVKPLSGSESPPSVLVQAAQSNGVMTGVAAVQASVVSTIPLSRVEFFVDNVLYDTANKANPAWNLDTRILSNGSHLLTVRAYDQSGLSGEGSLTVVVQNDKSPLARPNFPQKFSHIRLANLAYGALGPTEEQFLRQRTDLVIMDYHPGTRMEKVESVSPDTPQLLYTNVSNLYRDLLTDWLEFADRKGYSREGAFFHVTKATPFSGDGASTQPVNWFWSAWMTSLGKQTEVTTALRGTSASGTLLPSTGQSLLVGQADRFREINVNLVSGASEGWSGMLEYPTAVDQNGRPTAWAPLRLLQDGTAGWTTTGRITFDPPANWKASRAQDGSPLLYMVRLRNTLPGTAPVARSILGRDYFSVGSSTSGVIPAFDHAADLDRDGYLNDTEYARRAQGFDARFVHESRVFTYGPMRFSSNPRDLGFKAWAVDYHLRYLNKFPLADGLFVDNSGGASPVKPDAVRERTEFYSQEYAALLYDIGKAVAPRWLMANTAGGGKDGDNTATAIQGTFEEFGIRPLAHNYLNFESLAAQVARRNALGAGYTVLDSHPQNGSPTDPRTQISTLAYYYLLADPNKTMLSFFGGSETSTSWSRHWSDAAAFNVGKPTSSWSLFASGLDPASASLAYRVYQRTYDNALVLYKPLSVGARGNGTIEDNSATTHKLGGTYRVLQANGQLGATVTSITLRNGEGAILVRV